MVDVTILLLLIVLQRFPQSVCRQPLKELRGGRNVKNQNIERSERRKYLLNDQNVESQKIRTSKVKLDFQRSDLFGRHR
jgi:hypothetical protein